MTFLRSYNKNALESDVLLHFDGYNGDTILKDSSRNNCIIETFGNVSLSNVQSKFGTTSLYLDGTNTNRVRVIRPPRLAEARTFTMEGWFWTDSTILAGYSPLINLYDTGDGQGPLLLTDGSSYLRAIGSINSGFWDADAGTSTTLMPKNQWAHAAMSFDGKTFRYFLNGVQISMITNLYGFFKISKYIGIGEYPHFPGGPKTFKGYIDEIRIIGKCIYRSNFTPPTSRFEL